MRHLHLKLPRQGSRAKLQSSRSGQDGRTRTPEEGSKLWPHLALHLLPFVRREMPPRCQVP